MKKEANTVSQILNYWLMSEYTKQNDFPTFNTDEGNAGRSLRKDGKLPQDKKDKEKEYDKKSIIDFLPVTDFSVDICEAVRKNEAADKCYPVIGNTIYFAMGKLNRNTIVDHLVKLSKKDDLVEKAYNNTDIAWFSFAVASDGSYIEHSFKLSNLLWAISTIKKKFIKKLFIKNDLSYYPSPEKYKAVTEEIERQFLTGKNYAELIEPLYKKIYKEYVEYLVKDTGEHFKIDGICALYRYKETAKDADDVKETDLTDVGRSYITEDLDLVLSEIKNSNFGYKNDYEKQVLAYIASEAPGKRQDERTDVSTNSPEKEMKAFFREKLDPLRSPLGKWPSRYMPALMQQTAINIAIDEEEPVPVFSVNGPPGSGKTTLLKEIIAHYIVKRAELLCSVADPDNLFNKHNDPVRYYSIKNEHINDYSIIVTSCNNTAVENITKELPNQSDLLKGLSAKDDDSKKTAKELGEISSLFTPENSDDKLTVSVEKGVSKDLPDLFYTHYARKLLGNDDNWGLISAPLGKKSNINSYCYNFLNPLHFKSLCKRDEREKHLALFQKRCEEFKALLSEVLECQKKLHDFSAAPTKKIIDEYLEEFKANDESPTVIDDAFMKAYYSDDDGGADAPSTKAHTSDPWFTNEYNRKREKLFWLGLMVHKEFVLSSKAMHQNVGLLLRMWGSIENEDPKISNAAKEKIFTPVMQSLFLITPVISTTFASMQTLMRPVKQSGAFGLLIVDEAGQASPEMAVGSLFRCRHAMIVGDPKQVEPVVTTETMKIKEIVVTDSTRPYINRYISVQRFADSINPYGTTLDGDWVGCPLVVHRRCIDPMYTVSNLLSYGGTMKLQSTQPDETYERAFIYNRSGWINVGGEEHGNKDHYVEAQGKIALDMLRTKLEKIEKENKDKLDLYVISPFTSVVSGLKKQLKASDLWKQKDKYPFLKDWRENNIGTVHSFQGKGTDEVIFLLGCDKDAKGAVKWVNKNIINVAATRAKFRFYVIGDKKLWMDNNRALQYLESEWKKKDPTGKGTIDDLFPDIDIYESYVCPNCKGKVTYSDGSFSCENTGTSCDMVFDKLYGQKLSNDEIRRLLSGEKVQYKVEKNGIIKTALPESTKNEYKGQTSHIWKNKW